MKLKLDLDMKQWNRMLESGARRLPVDVKGVLTMGGIAFVWVWT
jgi:hypothetical protein